MSIVCGFTTILLWRLGSATQAVRARSRAGSRQQAGQGFGGASVTAEVGIPGVVVVGGGGWAADGVGGAKTQVFKGLPRP